MEFKSVSVICILLACLAFNVESASFYFRNGREIEIPVENEIIPKEIVSELKRESEPSVIEETVAVKDDVIVPIEELRVVAPVIEIQEPVAVISGKDEEINAIVEEEIAQRSANAESIVPVVVEEKIISVPIVEEPFPIVAVKEAIPITRNEPLVGIDEKEIIPEADIKKDIKEETPFEVVAVAIKSSPIEEPIVEEEKENVVVPDSPVVEKDESIRQSEAAGTTTTARPNVLQVISTGIQNFQHQLQSQLQNAFNPNAVTNADGAVTTVRPGFIAQIQQAFNRPAGSTGPFQGFVSAVQTNFQNNLPGIFRPNAAAASPTTVPVVVAPADPVAEKTMLEEVPVVNEKLEVQSTDEKVDKVKSD